MNDDDDTAGERLHSADDSNCSGEDGDQSQVEEGGDVSQVGEEGDTRASEWEDEDGGKQEHHLRLTS